MTSVANDDEFEATTYISHTLPADDVAAEADNPPEDYEASEISRLRQEIEELEQRLQTYEAETTQRIDQLEHSGNHHISPEERAFRILEDV